MPLPPSLADGFFVFTLPKAAVSAETVSSHAGRSQSSISFIIAARPLGRPPPPILVLLLLDVPSPPAFMLKGVGVRPDGARRLSWMDGEGEMK